MAQRVITQLVSDLSGVELADGEGLTVEFAVHGTDYRLDLTAEEAEGFEAVLAPYLEHATRVGRRGAGRSIGNFKKVSAPAEPGPDLNDVRAWARSHGYDVADRGRIKAEVLTAYAEAH